MDSGRFRDAAWDNQLDTMLDDLQATVQGGGGGHTTREYEEKNDGNRREVRERTSRTGGGDGSPYTFREERQYYSSSATNSNPGPMMGNKRGMITNGSMEQHILDEKRQDQEALRGRSDSLVSDLSSIAKVKSVSKTSYSESRYEYSSSSNNTQQQQYSTTSNTQQSIKKNINDLDHLLSNLSSHTNSREVSPSRRIPPSPGPQHVSSSTHMSRTEERRERLMSNSSQYRSPSLGRTPSQSRPHSPGGNHQPYTNGTSSYPVPRTPEPGHGGYPHHPEPSHTTYSHHSHQNTIKSNISSEFYPVHTTPDPLTGRYPDGRITPNHGFTKNFSNSANSPSLPRKSVPTDANANIPKRPEELLSSLGQEVDSTEIQRIVQEESVSLSRKEMLKREAEKEAREAEKELPRTKTTPGPPVYYPTGDLFTKKGDSDVDGEGGKGGYYAASYAGEKGSRSKEEKGEKGGAAVIPICLPLCCATPCVIL